MMSSSIVGRPGAVLNPTVGRELREPEAVLAQSSLDYARSTSISPNTELRPRIPGDPAAKFAEI
jgi:hypothetical protein